VGTSDRLQRLRRESANQYRRPTSRLRSLPRQVADDICCMPNDNEAMESMRGRERLGWSGGTYVVGTELWSPLGVFRSGGMNEMEAGIPPLRRLSLALW
jgi:hypothetical protein